MSRERYRPIGDYGFLSDCRSSALVSSEASIDWACLRRFDEASTFGRLLDADRGGYFSIRPVAELIGVERRYLPATMVLETTMTTADGSVRCTDAFAMSHDGAGSDDSELLRRAETLGDPIDVEVIIEPRFDYGVTRPWLRHHTDDRYTAVGGDDALIIHTNAPLRLERKTCRLVCRITLEPDSPLDLSVVAVMAHLVDTTRADTSSVSKRLDETIEWWNNWSAETNVEGEYADLLTRSALVLKGLTGRETGAIIAAPTTSLPEVPGGDANWDYRYSWVRDSTMTLASLADVGQTQVAQEFHDFVMRSSAGHGSEVQIMYGHYGERSMPERELPMEGWRGSSPVRTGNAAATQIQLDVYGHLLDAAHLWHHRGQALHEEEWEFLDSVVDQALARRNDAGSGIWELRGPPRHFVESKVMIWVALDRGIRLVEEYGYPCASLDEWIDARAEVRDEIDHRGVDPVRGNFVQHYDTRAVDASLLKLPLVGFVDAGDERMRTTTDVIIDELGVPPDGFVRRHLHNGSDDTSTGADEGVFLLCTAWLVEVLALQGRSAEAHALFDALAGTGNDLGLFSEEYDVETGELLGNFPQAFTHLGIIAACQRLNDKVRP